MNLISYYCTLRNIPMDDSPNFQDASEDRIRTPPDFNDNSSDVFTLPSVPSKLPNYLKHTSAGTPNDFPEYLKNIPEKKQEETEEDDDEPLTYPDPPEIYYIPITKEGEPKKDIIKCSLAIFKQKPQYLKGIDNETKPSPNNNFLRQSTPNLNYYNPSYLNPSYLNPSYLNPSYLNPSYLNRTSNQQQTNRPSNTSTTSHVPQYLQNNKEFFKAPPPPTTKTPVTNQQYATYSPLSGIPFNSAPNEPQGPQTYLNKRVDNKGIQLFEDVFSRADKSDDGGVTFEEFTDYFGDGVLPANDLLEIFNQMDLNSNGNIELPDLVNFFSNGFDSFQDLFSSLSQVHKDVSKVLVSTYRDYQNQDKISQFKTRVYIREFLSQISSLREPVQSAHESMVLASSNNSERIFTEEDIEQDNVESEMSKEVFALREQVDRLSMLVEHMATKQRTLRFAEQADFNVDDDEEHKVIVSRYYNVIPEMVLHFREVTRAYVSNVRQQSGNLLIYVSKVVNCCHFITYEIWDDETYLAMHNQTLEFRHYQKDLVDCLVSPAEIRTMPLPSSWWCY